MEAQVVAGVVAGVEVVVARVELVVARVVLEAQVVAGVEVVEMMEVATVGATMVTTADHSTRLSIDMAPGYCLCDHRSRK